MSAHGLASRIRSACSILDGEIVCIVIPAHPRLVIALQRCADALDAG